MKNINPADKRVRVLASIVDHKAGAKTVQYAALDEDNARTAQIFHYREQKGWELWCDGQTNGTLHKKADAVRLAAAYVADGTFPHEE